MQTEMEEMLPPKLTKNPKKWFFVNLGDKNNAYKFPKHFSANILVSNIRSYKCM